MGRVRAVSSVLSSVPTVEGAGVRLRRAFGHQQLPKLDPFLMLDEFGSDDPVDYLPGFPWHPHRGIETITYVLAGRVAHDDSLGNSGEIGPGDVQWMTAGSGIIHQEMPRAGETPRLHGFQLWANLPAAQKMTAPRYREVASREIPEVESAGGARVKVLSGELLGVRGPVRDVVIDPTYLDVSLPMAPRSPPRSPRAYRIRLRPRGRREARGGSGRRRPPGPARRRRRGRGPVGGFVRSLPAGRRQAARRARGVVGPDRDEHRGGAAYRARRVPARHVHQTRPLSASQRGQRCPFVDGRSWGWRS